MFKLLLLFATMASASASDFLVTEYYSDNTCTDVLWYSYATFKKMGCYYKTATTSEKLTKVDGGYNLTSYTSASDCTGAANAPQFNSKPASCEKMLTVWTKNVWKTSFPTTAAEIAKGEVAQFTYQNVAGQTCGTVSSGKVMKLGACANLTNVGHKHVFNSSDASQLVIAKYTGDATCANAISGYNDFPGVDSTTCTATTDPSRFQKIVVGTKESAPENSGSSQHFAYLFVTVSIIASILIQ